jgi:hypothetical protein
LLGLYLVADVQSPLLRVAKHGNLPGHGYNLGSSLGRGGKQLGKAGLSGGYDQQPANPPVDATQPHKVN